MGREAAYALNTYLKPPTDLVFDPQFSLGPGPTRMLELGSGTGINAATVAPMLNSTRDLMFVTDLPEVCPLLERNLKSNLHAKGGPLLVRPLSWGNFQHAMDIAKELCRNQDTPYLTHILCSDLVYFPELLAPLLRSLIQLSSPPFVAGSGEIQVIISYKIRSLAKETPFWAAFGLWFEFSPVLVEKSASELDGSASESWHQFGARLEDPIFIFVARRRKESFGWNLPESDQDLLHGGMVHGRRSDDTFETLLLMSLDQSDVL